MFSRTLSSVLAGVAAAIVLLPSAARAQEASTKTAIAINGLFVDALHSNTTENFVLRGGSVDYARRISPKFFVVGEFAGSHANSIGTSGFPLTLTTYLVGPRITTNDAKHKGPGAFAEVLVGIAHGSDSYFPTSTGFNSSATNFGLEVNGGFESSLSRRFSLRWAEVGYLYTHLPNGTNNNQSNVRFSAGLVFKYGK